MKNTNFHIDYPSYIDSLSRGYMASRILLTAAELGIFTHIEKKPHTVEEMAKVLNADMRGVEILLNALVGLRILQKTEHLYAFTPGAEEIFTPSSPHYKGGTLSHLSNLWEAWSDLTECILSGKPAMKQWTDNKSRGLSLAMKEHAQNLAHRIAQLIDCSNASHMLDMGGGPGMYSIAFAKRNPDLQVTLIDRDEQTLKIAGENITQERLHHRIKLTIKDFFTDDLGDGYDFVFLSSIVCLLGKEENLTLMRKINKALARGGRIAILDLMFMDSKTEPLSSVIFAVNMLVTTSSGRIYSKSEVMELLKEAGFTDLMHIPAGNVHIITGQKK